MDEKIIEEWLKGNSGSGWGSGWGSGEGSGRGSGWGYGEGSGWGYGEGSGWGYGRGSGRGSGEGSGWGYGEGSGWGSGEGSGWGYGEGSGRGSGIKYYTEYRVWFIDAIPTIIKRIHGNIASGFILNRDLTLEKTFIVKGQNKFAHGATLKETLQSLQEKIFENMDVDERIEEFRKHFNSKDKYLGSDFFKWHHILTGSCLQGRENFVKNNDLSLEDEFTVKEFIELCKNDFGGEIIERLEDYYSFN